MSELIGCIRNHRISRSLGKLILLCLALVFLGLGILGLILPVIPGLLFLFLAAVLAARLSPACDYMLRRNRHMARGLDAGNKMFRLSPWDQLKVMFWGSIKITIDCIDWILNLVAGLLRRIIKR